MINMNFGLNFLPTVTNTYSLGDSNHKWNIFTNAINGQSLSSTLLPAVTAQNNGQILKVDNGAWTVGEAPTSLPPISGIDNNKILQVSNGAWAVLPLLNMTGATSTTAGASGLVPAPNIGDQNKYLKADGTWDTNVVFLDYNVSTWNDFLTAYNAGKSIYCKVANGTNQWRIVPLTYSDLYNGSAEFNYYRSRDITNNGYVPDEIHVYKLLRSGNEWETTVRLINFSLATTSAPGLLEAADKTKLNKIDVSNSHFSVRGDMYMECDSEFLNGQKVASEHYVDSAVAGVVLNGDIDVPTMVGATAQANGTKGLVPAPTSSDVDKFLAGDGTYKSGGLPMVILSYGSSTWSDFINAYNNNVIVYCRASSSSNPASGTQGRMAFMAYVNNASSPTEVEFQYYRSVSSHSNSQMGDQVFVYKLTSSGTWSVTTREASLKQIKIGTGDAASVSYSSNVITLKGGLPAVTASDNGKILQVVNGVWTAVTPS